VILGLQIGLIVVSVLLTILVLLHRGKGGGISDMFGGGMSSSVGGSSVAERNLNRITLVLTVLWVALIVALSLILKNQ
jgi:preprotein translocase subunit SecG